MASNRHLGRVIVLQSLYEYELRTLAHDPEVDLDIVVAKNIEPYAKSLGDTEFVYNLTHKVAASFATLDEALRPLAPEWPIESISAIDRNILRMGLCELLDFSDQVPPKVAINEAVELAKAFGSDNSSRFINGVLGTAYRKQKTVENDQPKTKSSENAHAAQDGHSEAAAPTGQGPEDASKRASEANSAASGSSSGAATA